MGSDSIVGNTLMAQQPGAFHYDPIPLGPYLPATALIVLGGLLILGFFTWLNWRKGP